MAWLTSLASVALVSSSRWLDERFENARFRLRLIEAAICPIDKLPASLVLAVERLHSDIDWYCEDID